MLYLYDENTLKPLRLTPFDAMNVAKLSDSILVSTKIDETVLIASYEKTAYLVNAQHPYSLFRYCLYQFRQRTLKEFRIILYAAPKNWLYYALKVVSLISFGYYRLIPFPQTKKKEASL